MNIDKIGAGPDAPSEVNVLIEIPQGGSPVKYEIDKESGVLVVDRFLHTAMSYPANYGFVPCTLCDDGDPSDVLVISEVPVIPGCVIRSRPIAALKMRDEKGGDEKILAVPVDRLHPFYSKVRSVADLPEILTRRIEHFFSHYKDLEENKWVKVDGWTDAAGAEQLVREAMERYRVKK